jgi:hypothetical protein
MGKGLVFGVEERRFRVRSFWEGLTRHFEVERVERVCQIIELSHPMCYFPEREAFNFPDGLLRDSQLLADFLG